MKPHHQGETQEILALKKKVDNSRKWDMKHGIENKYFRRIKDTENLHIVSCAEKIQFLFLALV